VGMDEKRTLGAAGESDCGDSRRVFRLYRAILWSFLDYYRRHIPAEQTAVYAVA